MTKYNQTGTISEVRYVAVDGGKKCEVRVFVDGRDTNWLPKASVIGGAYKIHIPPRVGDQVMVHNENGKNEDGYVTDNIAFDKVAHHEEIDDDTLVMHAEDGTILKHDFKEKSIILYTPCTLDATIEDAVTLQCNSTLDATIEDAVTLQCNSTLDATIEDAVTLKCNSTLDATIEDAVTLKCNSTLDAMIEDAVTLKCNSTLDATIEDAVTLKCNSTLDATIEDAVTLKCNSTLDATIAEDVTIKAPKVILDAEVEITKNLSVAGTISDVEGSLTTHTHLGKVGPVPLVRAK